MTEAPLLFLLFSFTFALDQAPVPRPRPTKEKKITKVIVEEEPIILLGESELRRLEPYFVKQAWNWQQLYDKKCTLNPHPGSCLHEQRRWFFYPTFSKCYAFTYGGCGGTLNRFITEKHCLKSCVPKQRPLSPPPVVDEPTLAPPPDTGELNAMLSSGDNDTVEALQKMAVPPTAQTREIRAAPSTPPATVAAKAKVQTKTKTKATSKAKAAAATEAPSETAGRGPQTAAPEVVSSKTAKAKSKREFPSGRKRSKNVVDRNEFFDKVGIDRIILK